MGCFPPGIRFISIVDNADTANKGNKKSRQINGLVNEWYLEDMSDNIRSVLTNRRKNGMHIGSFALYGYMKDPEQKGHLIIDEEAAQVVRLIFRLFKEGMGKTAIARYLNDRGIPNPTEYKRQKGLRYQQPKGKTSTLWKYFAISHMLTNEIYIGNMVQGKYGSVSYKTKENKPRPKDLWYRVEHTHEPIIDQETWDAVQELLAAKAKPFNVGSIGLFARKVRCVNCGYTMRTWKKGEQRYLKCPNFHVAKDACPGAFISYSKLEQLVLDELNKMADEFLDIDQLGRDVELCGGLKARKQEIEADIATYQRRIGDLSLSIRALYIDKIKEIITESDFIDMSHEFSAERDRLTLQVQECQAQVELLEREISKSDDKIEMLRQYVHPEKLTREIVDAFVDYIEVGRRIPGTRIVPTKIHWKV